MHTVAGVAVLGGYACVCDGWGGKRVVPVIAVSAVSILRDCQSHHRLPHSLSTDHQNEEV